MTDDAERFLKGDPYGACRICPRFCGADRHSGRGYCGMGDTPRIARAALHFWEEPCISGTGGSGAVFFSGCSLRCVFCQNGEISAGGLGWETSPEELSETYLSLQGQGAHNLNLVTAGHFLPDVIRSLDLARERGLSIPVIWNSSGYETPEALRLLAGYVDVYLPDFKYRAETVSADLSGAPDYRETAEKAVAEMVRQTGPAVFSEDGMIRRGVLVRHLLLPGQKRAAREILRDLYETYGEKIWFSLLRQYTPVKGHPGYPELSRKVTRREYREIVDYMIGLGITQAFIQEGGAASEVYIPEFSGEKRGDHDE